MQDKEMIRKEGYSITYEGTWTWIAFDAKPARTILDSLKAAGFRWSRKRKAWYLTGIMSEALVEDTVEHPDEGKKPLFCDGSYLCPTCERYNLTRSEYVKGYQCNACADAEEGVVYAA